MSIEELYRAIVWPLYKRKDYNQPLYYFKWALKYRFLIKEFIGRRIKPFKVFKFQKKLKSYLWLK
jgi:hypothetical protein